MKKFFITLVAVTFFFILGCQENPVFDSGNAAYLNKEQISEKPSQMGTIPLEGQLQDPNFPSNYVTISGMIEYEHQMVFVDPIPPAPQYYISVNLSVEAIISDNDQPVEIEGVVSGTSEDIFYVSEEGIYILERYYEVDGMTDGMVLFLRFLVTTDGIGLNNMWLQVFQD